MALFMLFGNNFLPELGGQILKSLYRYYVSVVIEFHFPLSCINH